MMFDFNKICAYISPEHSISRLLSEEKKNFFQLSRWLMECSSEMQVYVLLKYNTIFSKSK